MVHPALKGAQTDMRQIIDDVAGLTDKQRNYIFEFLTGRSKSDAALASGYASQSGLTVHRSPKVQAALTLVIERFLHGELLPLAMQSAYRLLRDDSTPAGVRANLAVAVMDRAGFDAKRLQRAAGDDKDVAHKSAGELREEIEKIQRELDNRMVDVTPGEGDGEPNGEPATSQDLDMFE